MGYCDGYHRAFTNKSTVLINGALLAGIYTIWGKSNPKVLVDQ